MAYVHLNPESHRGAQHLDLIVWWFQDLVRSESMFHVDETRAMQYRLPSILIRKWLGLWLWRTVVIPPIDPLVIRGLPRWAFPLGRGTRG